MGHGLSVGGPLIDEQHKMMLGRITIDEIAWPDGFARTSRSIDRALKPKRALSLVRGVGVS